ncbi:signal recognition particle-docking protein FtsY [Corynebacterium flavescens]
MMPGAVKPGIMEAMNTPVLIGIIVAVALIVLLILLIVVGKKRGEAKQVSFEKNEEDKPKELTQEQKSGNYQAKSGFNFAPATAAQEREPVRNQQDQQAKQPQQDQEAQQPQDATAIANAQLAGEDPSAAAETAPTAQPAAQAQDEHPLEVQSEETQAATSADEATSVEETTSVDEAVEAQEVEEATSDAPAAEAAKPEVETAHSAPEASSAEDTVEPTLKEETAEETPQVPDAAENAKETSEATESTGEEAEATAASAEEAAAAAGAQVESAQEALAQEPGEQEVSEDVEVVEAPAKPQEDIAPAGGRLGRLRGRLSRSQNAIGQGLMGILSAGDLDEDAWEEIEDTLIMADLGTKSTLKVTESLREKIAQQGVSSEEEARDMLRAALIEVGHPEMDRSIKAMPNEGKPAVIMVVGVNGTGKTTTTGKLARVLVSMGRTVLLGAADTFRAAAADQLETWGRRVGASTVRGKEGADPASVAFDAVAAGVDKGVDVVLVDTAGRLHTSVDLMDQLGKVKRVVEKKAAVDEVLLVLDATVGQNGLTQARIFRDVVDITGVVLTKLDGTAKGGIVFQVQEELGVPVKLVGLGEGADDLAPFEVESFVDALLGEK